MFWGTWVCAVKCTIDCAPKPMAVFYKLNWVDIWWIFCLLAWQLLLLIVSAFDILPCYLHHLLWHWHLPQKCGHTSSFSTVSKVERGWMIKGGGRRDISAVLTSLSFGRCQTDVHRMAGAHKISSSQLGLSWDKLFSVNSTNSAFPEYWSQRKIPCNRLSK